MNLTSQRKSILFNYKCSPLLQFAIGSLMDDYLGEYYTTIGIGILIQTMCTDKMPYYVKLFFCFVGYTNVGISLKKRKIHGWLLILNIYFQVL